MNHVGDNLKYLRKLRGATLTQFSQEIGISRSTLQTLEKGSSPNLSTLEVIAQNLDLPVSALLGEPEELICLRLIQQFHWLSGWPQDDLKRLCSLFEQAGILLIRNAHI